MNAPDLSAMNGRQLREYNRKRLDEAWAKKYPNGMGYIIHNDTGLFEPSCPSYISYGIVVTRPANSTRYRFHRSTLQGRRGWYTGSSYWTVKKHRTFSDLKEWKIACLKLGINPEELPDV